LQSPHGNFDLGLGASRPVAARTGAAPLGGSSIDADIAFGAERGRDELSEDDRKSLSELKRKLVCKEEAQITVKNYKKGGIPFVNVLTTIPLRWESASDELRYIVEFQADRTTLFL